MSRVPQPSPKVWGSTDALLRSPLFEMHRLVVKSWHRCSMHVHRHKHNAFYVLAGVLYVDVVHGDPHGRMEHHKLLEGDHLCVPPGVSHQFRTGVEGAYLLEVYFTEPLSEDIHRFDEGRAI